MPKTAKSSTPKKTPKEQATTVKKEIVKAEKDESSGKEKGIKLASFKTQAKNLGIRCQRIAATLVIRDYIHQKIKKMARVGVMNANARGAATIQRKDCQEICKV